jgi:hypothetical protein
MKPYMNRDFPGDVAVSHAFYDLARGKQQKQSLNELKNQAID